jgi:hypothetical protein
MLPLGRILVLLLGATLAVASLPPGLDEDRSAPGFCSPDCQLQHDGAARSMAIAPMPIRQDRPVEASAEHARFPTAEAPLARPASPDAPRAPPGT